MAAVEVSVPGLQLKIVAERVVDDYQHLVVLVVAYVVASALVVDSLNWLVFEEVVVELC